MNYNKNDLFIGNFNKLCRTCLSKNNIDSIFTTIKNTDAEIKNALEHFEIDVNKPNRIQIINNTKKWFLGRTYRKHA